MSMKKSFFIVLVLLTLMSCHKSNSSKFTNTSRIPNPLVQSSAQEILNKLGFSFKIPEGAQEISYSIIADELAQMDFTWNAIKCCARIKASSQAEDISGCYYSWEKVYPAKISYNDVSVKYITESDGNIIAAATWYDKAPGISYSFTLSVPGIGPGNIDDVGELCRSLAEETWIQTQGEN